MAVGLPYTPCSGSVQTAPRCFVQKARYGALGLKGVVRHQVSVMELNVNAPLTTCRNRTKLRTKLLIFEHWQDKAVTGGCLLVTGSPALRWQELYTGVYTKRERLTY